MSGSRNHNSKRIELEQIQRTSKVDGLKIKLQGEWLKILSKLERKYYSSFQISEELPHR